MKEELQAFADLINNEIENLPLDGKPKELYEPIRYLMSLGGKRLRPLLTLMSYSLYKDDFKSAAKSAVALELFHNFTLMHDDIMDRAPLRRGKKTVHKKYNDNIAILSGDVMLVKVYELFLNSPSEKLKEILSSFNLCAAQVCEGQQLDMNYESTHHVTEKEYLEMIALKTAALVGYSLELGAILGGADVESRNFIKEFGINMGLGFQLKDDLLDVYADKEKFGKVIGGDIIANKKTFLLIKALEGAEGDAKKELEEWIKKDIFKSEDKIAAVKQIYNKLKIKELTEKKIQEYFDHAFSALEQIAVAQEKKATLKSFAQYLINREE